MKFPNIDEKTVSKAIDIFNMVGTFKKKKKGEVELGEDMRIVRESAHPVSKCKLQLRDAVMMNIHELTVEEYPEDERWGEHSGKSFLVLSSTDDVDMTVLKFMFEIDKGEV